MYRPQFKESKNVNAALCYIGGHAKYDKSVRIAEKLIGSNNLVMSPRLISENCQMVSKLHVRIIFKQSTLHANRIYYTYICKL